MQAPSRPRKKHMFARGLQPVRHSIQKPAEMPERFPRCHSHSMVAENKEKIRAFCFFSRLGKVPGIAALRGKR
jgi:hypothetical protein